MTTHCRKFFLPFLGLLFVASTFAGELTSRMELSLDRVLHGGPPTYTDDFVLADAVPEHVRRFTEFSGDVSGRYIGALATAAQFSGKKFPELNRIVTKILKLQKEDGHFGDPFSTNEVTKSDMALMWGNGRLLIGLLEYYRLNPVPEVLASARRLGDYFVKVGPRYNDPAIVQKFSGDQVAVGYICWTQIIEGLVELNRITHDDKYLKLSGEIARNTHRHPKQHSHGFACALRGILELYRVTHDDQWLKKVEAEWDGIIHSGNLLPQGALPEIFKPLIARDEGCAEADWVRLSLGLWAETRNPRYLESAELSLFNEFFFNQFSTGDYGHHRFTESGVAPQSARAWWCCTFHGLRAFPDIARAAFHAETTRLGYDLPVDGQGTIAGLTMQADSRLAQDATVSLTVTKADKTEYSLSIRQPVWASALVIKLNRQIITGVAKTEAVEIQRRWQKGDRLTVQYVLRTRLLTKPQDASRVAIWHGPWLLGVNEQNEPTFFDEPMEKNHVLLPAVAANGDLLLKTIIEKSKKSVPFTAPAAHLALPYLPGGYLAQPQTATLRPIAEHTAVADSTSWVWWFQAMK
ncbi:MAG: beta-L-arabinofuranosidase domain-containing protein [Verrucomicrobiota bacterium]